MGHACGQIGFACLLLCLSVSGAFAQGDSPQPVAPGPEAPLASGLPAEPAPPHVVLFVGLLPDVNHPEGFAVEDMRPEAMKASHREQIYRKPAFSVSRGPFARYRRNFGDTEFNVPLLDLLEERMIERYGDKLRGKKLVVHEFSVIGLETIDRPQSVNVTSSGSIGAAVVAGLASTVLIQAMGPGRSFRLEVKIDAELDGKPFTGSDFGSLMPSSPMDVPATIVNQALENAFYEFEQPEAAPAAEEARPAAGPPKGLN
jgi:hypothetical protein